MEKDIVSMFKKRVMANLKSPKVRFILFGSGEGVMQISFPTTVYGLD